MLLTVHISILLFVLIAYILNSYQNAVDGVEQSAGNFIGLYGNEFNAISWMVSSTTDVPEAAMKFLNLTFTDEDIINLIIYGIEERDYVIDEDGYVSYPEGQDSTTVPYTAQLSCGSLDLDNFVKALNDAGYQDILDAKQKQLDAWLAE